MSRTWSIGRVGDGLDGNLVEPLLLGRIAAPCGSSKWMMDEVTKGDMKRRRS